MKVSDFLKTFDNDDNINVEVDGIALNIGNVMNHLDKEVKEIKFNVRTFYDSDKIVKEINIKSLRRTDNGENI